MSSEENIRTLQFYPHELLIKIFSYFHFDDIIKCREVCRSWNDLINDFYNEEISWWTKCCEINNIYFTNGIRASQGMSWETIYNSMKLWSQLEEATVTIERASDLGPYDYHSGNNAVTVKVERKNNSIVLNITYKNKVLEISNVSEYIAMECGVYYYLNHSKNLMKWTTLKHGRVKKLDDIITSMFCSSPMENLYVETKCSLYLFRNDEVVWKDRHTSPEKLSIDTLIRHMRKTSWFKKRTNVTENATHYNGPCLSSYSYGDVELIGDDRGRIDIIHKGDKRRFYTHEDWGDEGDTGCVVIAGVEVMEVERGHHVFVTAGTTSFLIKLLH